MTKENGQQAAKSMVSGLVIAILLAFVVSFFVENDSTIWAWAIPSGLGIGLMAGSLPIMKKGNGLWQLLGLSGYLLIFIAIASIDYFFGSESLREFAGIVVTLIGITTVMGVIMRLQEADVKG